MNSWRIPAWLEREVTDRDRHCVYCRQSFEAPDLTRAQRPSWEHIVNDARIVTLANIARCCIGCNASKGAKPLAAWLGSQYCVSRGITSLTVAPIVQRALAILPDEPLVVCPVSLEKDQLPLAPPGSGQTRDA